ncbi:Putative uncharacterized protein [Taphrina deformans PYCC 5710]|uniref:Fe2OG dioxygenase domain-containing protein n=1 Tax=Taphrina deformans (strain PYCC 5710 / ATCC 11124 / CBS 356.35 / IMI 108563 / JCM 9778 / NBRC 8474) TaxID=1097556 RepID=R4X7E5_TAPDE|nr:Putative uncharacterized protein [Taphrina deformans PYCC 5710]|eukprot:CCG81008.1 Putative uncharacterized protein [Taphrina deformans PYCC 5710]
MGKSVRNKQEAKTAAAGTVSLPSLASRSDHDYRDQYRVEVLLEDQICLIDAFLTPLNRQHLLSLFERAVLPLLSRPSAPRRGEATRTNGRFAVHDPVFAESLFRDTDLDRCLDSLGLGVSGARRLVGLNPNIRIYRYPVGTFFGPHFDDSVTDPETKWKSEWTLLVYLTDGDLQGGETAFQLPDGSVLAPAPRHGLALIHRHGTDCLLHEGRPVKQGTKWVLRSDLMYA